MKPIFVVTDQENILQDQGKDYIHFGLNTKDSWSSDLVGVSKRSFLEGMSGFDSRVALIGKKIAPDTSLLEALPKALAMRMGAMLVVEKVVMTFFHPKASTIFSTERRGGQGEWPLIYIGVESALEDFQLCMRDIHLISPFSQGEKVRKDSLELCGALLSANHDDVIAHMLAQMHTSWVLRLSSREGGDIQEEEIWEFYTGLSTDPHQWPPIYNISATLSHSLIHFTFSMRMRADSVIFRKDPRAILFGAVRDSLKARIQNSTCYLEKMIWNDFEIQTFIRGEAPIPNDLPKFVINEGLVLEEEVYQPILHEVVEELSKKLSERVRDGVVPMSEHSEYSSFDYPPGFPRPSDLHLLHWN